MKRLLVFAYGVICYAVFFATFLYAIGFIGGSRSPRPSSRNKELPTTVAIRPA